MRAPFGLIWKGLTPVYLAVVVLGSILAHIAAEFFAMGSDADAVALSPRHLYLAVAALACATFAFARVRALLKSVKGLRELKRELHIALESLPLRGRGPAFYVFTAAIQFGVSLATQYGEGCPFCSHDIAAGIAGALLTVIALALCAWLVALRLPSLAAAVEALFVEPQRDQHTIFVTRGAAARAFPRFIWSAQLYNRPPPLPSIG